MIARMGNRSGYQRQAVDIKPGRIEAWEATDEQRSEIAAKVRYRGNGAHKTYTSPTKEWEPSLRKGKSVCWQFSHADWPKLVALLRQAIIAGCVHAEFKGEFPTRVWAFINGKLHEARLHNSLLGEYHGFPLEYQEHYPSDPHEVLKGAPRE
jgi:hypothetical protein